MNGWWALVIVVCVPSVALVLAVLLSPAAPKAKTERCLFDEHWWLIAGETVGGSKCSGDPEMHLAFWDGHPAAHLTGRLVCTAHVADASELASKIARAAI